MAEETWTCPGCAQKFPLSTRVCPYCMVTQVRRRETRAAEEKAEFTAEQVDVQLPLAVPGARFSVPTDAGPVWTSGALVLADPGVFMLAEKDRLDAGELVRTPPAAPGRLGTVSLYLPKGLVKRIVHNRLVGFFVEESSGQKIPLRLEAAAWKAVDAACDKLGIPHQ